MSFKWNWLFIFKVYIIQLKKVLEYKWENFFHHFSDEQSLNYWNKRYIIEKDINYSEILSFKFTYTIIKTHTGMQLINIHKNNESWIEIPSDVETERLKNLPLIYQI